MRPHPILVRALAGGRPPATRRRVLPAAIRTAVLRNDPESYEYYQDLEEGWESGEWDSENGFSGGDSGFEDYLYENDRDSYDSYQDLEDGWNSGTWDPENGFFQ